jgi:hypothetical protein
MGSFSSSPTCREGAGKVPENPNSHAHKELHLWRDKNLHDENIGHGTEGHFYKPMNFKR